MLWVGVAMERIEKERQKEEEKGGGSTVGRDVMKGGWREAERRAARQFSLAWRPQRGGTASHKLHNRAGPLTAAGGHFLPPFATFSITSLPSMLAYAGCVTRRRQSSSGYTHWEVDW